MISRWVDKLDHLNLAQNGSGQWRLRRHFSLILNPKVRLTVVELVETYTVTKIAISALSSDGDLYFF
jgi:hypothetical protein